MVEGNPLKRKLRAGQACFGAWMLSTSADMAEILAYAGMDFLLLDHEHGQGSIDDAIAQLRAIKGSRLRRRPPSAEQRSGLHQACPGCRRRRHHGAECRQRR